MTWFFERYLSPQQLAEQYQRASHDWPEIAAAERQYGLPAFYLFAIGSRETNLTDEIGDGGHGHGIFQLDDRSHTIPSPYPVSQQANDAAEHLAEGFRATGDWQSSANIYNSGQAADRYTANGDYGSDVMSRMEYLQQTFTNTTTTGEDMTPDECRSVVREELATIKQQLDQDLTSTIKGYLTDFWNNQFAPALNNIGAKIDAEGRADSPAKPI